MTDYKKLKIIGKWALAADSLQWMLQRSHRNRDAVVWDGVSFVHSTKKVLARCMGEKGVPPRDAAILLQGLPDTFSAWLEAHDVN